MATGSTAPTGRIDDEKMHAIAEAAWKFCEMCSTAAGVKLFPYQVEFGQRVVRSIVLEDTAELTALFSRQSGKTETVAVVVTGLMILLPALAKVIPDDRMQKFSKGLWVGYFAPDYGTVDLLTARVRDRLFSSGVKEIMADPDLELEAMTESKKLELPNGSHAWGQSTNPRLSIEGRTYHLIICDETQYIPDWRITKSIHPMGAQTAATIVKLGTPIPQKCEFWAAIQRNKRKDTHVSAKKQWQRSHWEVPWEIAAKYSKRYLKFVTEEMERLGEESDDFRMSYRLHWIMERGQFVGDAVIEEIAINVKSDLRIEEPGKRPVIWTRSSNVVTYDRKARHVVGLDIGRTNDSTVATVGRVLWEAPRSMGGRTVFPIHVANWLELQGDDHEAQYPQLLDFFANYAIDSILVDSTGRGDPVYSRLRAELEPQGIQVHPYVFSQQSKDVGFRLLLQEIQHKRITYPGGAAVRRLAKYKRFRQQFGDLEKTWRGKYLVVEAPKGKGRRMNDSHDDYPDSLMLTLMATQMNAQAEVEMSDNPFFEQGFPGIVGRRAMPSPFRGRQEAWWR